MYSTKKIGLQVKAAREQRSKKTNQPFTQKMLAAKIGETSKWVKRLERGELYPDWDSLSLLADICGVSVSYITGEEFSSRSQYDEAIRGGKVARTVNLSELHAP